MKKKFLLISLSVCVLAASIIGCGSTGGTEPDTTTQETEAGDTADTSDQETEVSEDLSADAASAKEMIDTLAINTDAFQPDSAEISEYREPVTLARSLFDNLPEEDQQALDADGTLNLLVQAEARVLNLWIRDTPLDSVEDGGITWIMEERYDAVSEALGEDTAKELVPLYETKFLPYNDLIPGFQEEKRENLKAGQEVDAAILDMDPSDADAVAEVAKMYDNLTDMQQTYVEHYSVLRDALGEKEDFSNIVYSGTRSSVYGLGDTWLLPDEWKQVTDQLQEWYPQTQTTMVWIIGSLSGMGCNLEFTPSSDVDTEALARQYIYFSEPDRENHLSHEEYFKYFDNNNIKVYLQVEPGFADVDTLIDLIMDQYGDHPCIAGIGVDVEWYHGVTEDSGLPVSDAMAEKWDKHIKEINPEYRLFLKHYNIRYLPPTYRSDILFVNDSQGFGSPVGDALGTYDENLDDVLGFFPEFKRFADAFPDNDVLYQIGYASDESWFYTMDDPVVLSLGQRLSEVTKQNCGIIWVDFTIKDPKTFPFTQSSEDRIKSANRLLGCLNPDEEEGGLVGKRLAGVSSDPALPRDAVFVEKVREIIDSLTDEEKDALDADRLTYLDFAESAVAE